MLIHLILSSPCISEYVANHNIYITNLLVLNAIRHQTTCVFPVFIQRMHLVMGNCIVDLIFFRYSGFPNSHNVNKLSGPSLSNYLLWHLVSCSGYIEPVIVILQEEEHTWAGRVSWKHHTCMLSALSINTTLKQHPVIWSAIVCS